MRVAYLLRWTIALPVLFAACTKTHDKTPVSGLKAAEALPASPSPAASAEPQLAMTEPANAAPSTEATAASSVAAAETAAESWLALVDAAKYTESWQAAAGLLQKAISPEDWSTAAAKARTPFGRLHERHLRSAAYETTLPGLPDGKYVVIRYDAAFENNARALETITPMQSADGSWKVAGYFIR